MERIIKRNAVGLTAAGVVIIMVCFAVCVLDTFWQLAHAIAIVGVGLLAWQGKKTWGRKNTLQGILASFMGFYAVMLALMSGGELFHLALNGVLISLAYTLSVGAVASWLSTPKPENWAEVGVKISLSGIIATIALVCIIMVCGVIPSKTILLGILIAELVLLVAFLGISFRMHNNKKN